MYFVDEFVLKSTNLALAPSGANLRMHKYRLCLLTAPDEGIFERRAESQLGFFEKRFHS